MVRKQIFLLVTFLAILSVCCGQTVEESSSIYVDDVGGQGAQNAVKKAHQMTDLEFVPVDTIIANNKKTYQPGQIYKGLIYSSVKETNTFVGLDVSFHTFMTAVHNPRSVLYTENVGQLPYHGKNAASYYGTVCSALVSYALGLGINLKSYDFPKSDRMMLVENQSAKGIQLADVLWRKGHVALVTGIRRRKDSGEIVRVEISEAWGSGCRRRFENGEAEFDGMLEKGKWKIFRYKDLETNTYTPCTEYVAVEGEEKIPFEYNEAICPNKGDKSCYITGEKVVLNLAKGYENIEIYKDSILYKCFDVGKDGDIVLESLPYGDYKARLISQSCESDFTYWKVIGIQVEVEKDKKQVSFHSNNANPVYMEYCTISGGRPQWGLYVFNDSDITNGFVKTKSLPFSKKLKRSKLELYVRVCFSCEYGRVINSPILWKKGKENNDSKQNDTANDSID